MIDHKLQTIYYILAMARVNPGIPWCKVKSRNIGRFCGNMDKYRTLRKTACLSPSKLDKDPTTRHTEADTRRTEKR